MLPPDTPPDTRVTAPRASAVNKKYDMTPTDIELQNALHKFRWEKTAEMYSMPYLINCGPGIILGDDTLQRIVDCARIGKLCDAEQLKRETKWGRSEGLGFELLSVVHKCVSFFVVLSVFSDIFYRHYPLPPSPPPNETHESSQGAAGSTAKTVRHCRACGSTSHIREYCHLFTNGSGTHGL